MKLAGLVVQVQAKLCRGSKQMNQIQKAWNSVFHRRVTPESMLDDLVAINTEVREKEGDFVPFNMRRAVDGMRDIREVLASYMFEETQGDVVTAAVAYDIERVTAAANTQYEKQVAIHGVGINQRILAAMRLAEDTMDLEGDLFAGIMAPIELSLTSRVWVTARDKALMEQINDLLQVWNVMETICSAWQDMEYYSAFYVSHAWSDGRPTPIHWSPKRVAVGSIGGFYNQSFSYLPANKDKLDDKTGVADAFYKVVTGKTWNEWAEKEGGSLLLPEFLSWKHFLKLKHKVYPYPWVAKGATPAYTRQIIEEMRLGLVQGVMNQLWVMTIEEPHAGEVKRLKEVISAGRAERVGYLIWRAGLKVDVYSPNAIEQLLMPEAWWGATLDMFRRVGRVLFVLFLVKVHKKVVNQAVMQRLILGFCKTRLWGIDMW